MMRLVLSRPTLVDWQNFIRDVFVERFLEETIVVGGPGMNVQIDETHIVDRKYHRGRNLANQQTWLLGGVDEKGEVFMKVVEKRDKETLHGIIKKHIRPGSIIVSDCWKAYNGLENEGYIHKKVNHSEEFVNSSGFHTNRIEAFWGAFKRMFSSIRNKRGDLIESYVAEYLFIHRYEHDIIYQIILTINKLYPL